MELFLGSYFNSKRSLKNSFSGAKMTPGIQELEVPVPEIFTPLSELN